MPILTADCRASGLSTTTVSGLNLIDGLSVALCCGAPVTGVLPKQLLTTSNICPSTFPDRMTDMFCGANHCLWNLDSSSVVMLSMSFSETTFPRLEPSPKCSRANVSIARNATFCRLMRRRLAASDFRLLSSCSGNDGFITISARMGTTFSKLRFSE